MNELLALGGPGGFFAFFWEDYYTVAKFFAVGRRLLLSLALLLRWPTRSIAVCRT